jgi:hypothetical protein
MSTERPKNNFTEEEVETLKKYISGGFHLKFNEKLRENTPLKEDEIKNYLNLYNIIDKNRIQEDMTVYRGIKTTEEEFIKFLGLNRAFTSTSKTKPFHSDECCQLIIHLKKGSRAMDISRFNKQEDEVLIAPGIFNVIRRYEKELVNKIPSISFSKDMKIIKTYIEKVVPTVYYELFYTDYDGNNGENVSENEEKNTGYDYTFRRHKSLKRKSLKRKSLKRKSLKRKSLKRKSLKRKSLKRKSLKRK